MSSLVAPGTPPSPVTGVSQCREQKSTLGFRSLLVRIDFPVGLYYSTTGAFFGNYGCKMAIKQYE